MEIENSKVEILNDRGWEAVTRKNLKKYDIFRSYTSEGNLFEDNQGNTNWIVLADPLSGNNGIVYIKAVSFKEKEPHGN